jgi:hypothetical protein
VMTQEPLTADEIACMELGSRVAPKPKWAPNYGLSQHQGQLRRRAAFKAWGAPMLRNGQFGRHPTGLERARCEKCGVTTLWIAAFLRILVFGHVSDTGFGVVTERLSERFIGPATTSG